MPIQDTPAHPPKPVKPSHPEVANPAPPPKQSADGKPFSDLLHTPTWFGCAIAIGEQDNQNLDS